MTTTAMAAPQAIPACQVTDLLDSITDLLDPASSSGPMELAGHAAWLSGVLSTIRGDSEHLAERRPHLEGMIAGRAYG